MATFTQTITYPDTEQTRILTALKSFYGVATNAEALEAFRVETAQRVKTIVRHEERKNAIGSVTDTNPS